MPLWTTAIEPETCGWALRSLGTPCVAQRVWAMPAGPDAHQYVYFDVATGNGKLLLARPGPELPDGQRLWDAMAMHFAGELRPPTRTTMNDWPAIGEAWRDYFINRKGKDSPSVAPSAVDGGAGS